MARRRKNQPDYVLVKAIVAIVVLGAFALATSPQLLFMVKMALTILIGAGLLILTIYSIYRLLSRLNQPSSTPISTEYIQDTAPRESMRERAARYSSFGDVSVTERPIEVSGYPVEEPDTMTERELREKLRAIDWYQFEKLTALIFEAEGYVVDRRGGAHADGGIDMVIEKNGQRLGVQCKHWKKWNVRPKEVREFVGALHIAELESGYYVTLQGCTEAAEELANERMIQFVDETNVINSIRTRDGLVKPEMLRLLNDKNKYCPKCGSVMEIKYGKKSGKSFWGCTTFARTRCDGKVWIEQ